jgi:hypothetical protein
MPREVNSSIPSPSDYVARRKGIFKSRFYLFIMLTNVRVDVNKSQHRGNGLFIDARVIFHTHKIIVYNFIPRWLWISVKRIVVENTGVLSELPNVYDN